MMLHRHFEAEKEKNITTLADVTPHEKEEYVSEIFPPDEETPVEAPKRRGRPAKKSED